MFFIVNLFKIQWYWINYLFFENKIIFLLYMYFYQMGLYVFNISTTFQLYGSGQCKHWHRLARLNSMITVVVLSRSFAYFWVNVRYYVISAEKTCFLWMKQIRNRNHNPEIRCRFNKYLTKPSFGNEKSLSPT